MLQETMLLPIVVFSISALPVLTVPEWFAGIGRAFPVTSSVAVLYEGDVRPPRCHRAVGNRQPGLGHRLPGRRLHRLPRAGVRHQGARRARRL